MWLDQVSSKLCSFQLGYVRSILSWPVIGWKWPQSRLVNSILREHVRPSIPTASFRLDGKRHVVGNSMKFFLSSYKWPVTYCTLHYRKEQQMQSDCEAKLQFRRCSWAGASHERGWEEAADVACLQVCEWAMWVEDFWSWSRDWILDEHDRRNRSSDRVRDHAHKKVLS